uniref:Putative ionotropic glutamate receptor, metazoa, Periplasmic binding protein-like I n=1 Tax=Helianthus annuus TaxID=4232 RepID=A0A251SI77_HELAN
MFFYDHLSWAVHDLLNNIKVQAIIGPETYLEAKLLAPIADKAKVPIFSFAGSPSIQYPFLYQIKEDESVMSKSITALVDSFGWREVVYLYDDIERGREILSYFLESFQDKSIRVSQGNEVPDLSADDQITKELQKIRISHTRVIVLHMSSLLAYRVILIAKGLGMVNENYAWIVAYKTIDILQPVENEVIESYQGVIGLRSYIPASGKLLNLTTRWYNECYKKSPSLGSREVSVLAVWAYDTIWALAESVQRLGLQFSLVVTQIDLMLPFELSKTRFKGVSGDFQLNDGKLVSNGFKVVNVIGNGERGGSTTTQTRRMLQTTGGKKLKVGVLTRRKFTYFIDAFYDIQKNVTTATGFSVDAFDACISALQYEYELIPFANGTYDDLIKKVYVQEIDAILGDSTILANRSQFVDFTATYTDMGIGTLAKIKHNDMWIFLKPLDMDLWLITIAFAIFTGFVVWAIESMDQKSQKSPSQQIGPTFWFILMTLFFAQREKLATNLAKFVVFVWLLFVLILIASYTAILTSLVTVEQFELASKGGTLGFHGGSFVAGRTVSNLQFGDYRHRPYYSYDDYVNALSKDGKHNGADAIIDEIPYIKMFLGMHSSDYAMISSEPTTSGFGFIFQKGSPLVSDMSRQIATIRENGTLRFLEKKWFEKESSSSQDSTRKPKTLNFSRFRGLFLISGISSAAALIISLIFLLHAKLEVHSIISFIMQKNLVAYLRHLFYGNAIRI